MPGGKTHVAIGVGVGLALGARLPVTTAFPWQLGLTVALAALGSLAPDLDIADNELEELGRNEAGLAARRIRRIARRRGWFLGSIAAAIAFIVWLLGEIISRLVEGLAWTIQRFTPHRGLTHSLLMVILVTLAGLSLSTTFTATRTAWWGVAWGAGYLSHIAADALTFSGIKLLQPWSEQRFWLAPRPLRFRVGTWPDALLGAIAPPIGLLILLLAHGLLESLVTVIGG